jgi:hypothetical protein
MQRNASMFLPVNIFLPGGPVFLLSPLTVADLHGVSNLPDEGLSGKKRDKTAIKNGFFTPKNKSSTLR